jgi:ribosomal protein L11 methyltransferase
LSPFGPAQLVVYAKPFAKTARLEIYDNKPAALRALAKKHGGSVAKLNLFRLSARAKQPRKPLRLTKDCAVLDTHGTWPTRWPRPRFLLRIGSDLAFGTGEHATTASCLRLLQNETSGLTDKWTALDVGTGSGILAIAAEKFGAGHIDAFDYDALALRTAERHGRLNHCRRIRFAEKNLLRWKPTRRYRVVLANVFSEILRQAAPQLTRAVAADGCLILSGIFRVQENDVLPTFCRLGFVPEKIFRRGKWSALLMRHAQSS